MQFLMLVCLLWYMPRLSVLSCLSCGQCTAYTSNICHNGKIQKSDETIKSVCRLAVTRDCHWWDLNALYMKKCCLGERKCFRFPLLYTPSSWNKCRHTVPCMQGSRRSLSLSLISILTMTSQKKARFLSFWNQQKRRSFERCEYIIAVGVQLLQVARRQDAHEQRWRLLFCHWMNKFPTVHSTQLLMTTTSPREMEYIETERVEKRRQLGYSSVDLCARERLWWWLYIPPKQKSTIQPCVVKKAHEKFVQGLSFWLPFASKIRCDESSPWIVRSMHPPPHILAFLFCFWERHAQRHQQ